MRQSLSLKLTIAVLLAGLTVAAAGQDSDTAAAPATAASAPGNRGGDSSVAPSEAARLASKGILLDSVRIGEEIVAVGERGAIVRGAGDQWQQVVGVPTRATLTAIHAVGDAAWAVGHDGVILHSADAGRTWARQRVDAWNPQSGDPQSGVPLLDVLFLDARHGFAVGAYSLLLETRDGGATWTARPLLGGAAEPAQSPEEAATDPAEDTAEDAVEAGNESWNFSADELDLDEESDPHLNAIARTGSGALIIASERGTAFRSRDQGATWSRLKLPYAGSMFGAIGFDNNHALLFGLRGNVLETFDLGDTWQEVESGVEASLMGGSPIGTGGALLVGANGVLLRRDDAESAFNVSRFRTAEGESPILAGAVIDSDGGIIVFGERGIAPFRN